MRRSDQRRSLTRFSSWLRVTEVSMLVKTPATVLPCCAITPEALTPLIEYVYEAASLPTPEMGAKLMLSPAAESLVFSEASSVEKKLEGTPFATSTMTTEVPTRYSHPVPVAPEGRFPDSSMVVGEATVCPSAPPTVEVEGHEVAPAAAAALLEAGAEVAPAAAAALELDVPEEDDDVEVEVPQAARAATAISPVRSDGRVSR
jgi:hypothetical protein